MSPITQKIRESLEYVDSMKMFPENEGSELIQYDRIGTEEIKSHLLQSQIKLLDAVIIYLHDNKVETSVVSYFISVLRELLDTETQIK